MIGKEKKHGKEERIYDHASPAGGCRGAAGLPEDRGRRDGQPQLRRRGRAACAGGGAGLSAHTGRFAGPCAVSCQGGRRAHRHGQPEPQARPDAPPRRVRHQPEAGVVGLRCGFGPDGGRPCLCAGKRLCPARYRGAQRQCPRHPAV